MLFSSAQPDLKLSGSKMQWMSVLASLALVILYVLFALMQKERKKSRAKYASTHMLTHPPYLARASAL